MNVLGGRVAVAVVLAACTVSGVACTPQAHPAHGSTTQAAVPSITGAGTSVREAPAPVPMSTSTFSVVSIRHPSTWHAYLEQFGTGQPDGDSAYLTNEPINPRCTVDASVTPARVQCPGTAVDLDRLGPGGVFIEVEELYQDPADRSARGIDIDGYRAAVQTGAEAMAECTMGGVRRAVAVTATPPTDATQPGDVWLFACFGSDTAAARQEFLDLLPMVTIKSRPAETVAVADAAPCTRRAIRLRPVHAEAPGSQMFALGYEITNTGRRTCSIEGYPRVVLTSRSHHALLLQYAHGDLDGKARALYLGRGMSASFALDSYECQQPPYVVAATARITLPGIPQPYGTAPALRQEGRVATFCDDSRHPPIVQIQPLFGV